MKINKKQIHDSNLKYTTSHKENFDYLANRLTKNGYDVTALVSKLSEFQVAIPRPKTYW